AEIVDAVRQLVADGVPADKVDEKAIRSRLYIPEMPDPELMVRTSGESRTSNYLLWQLAYSELVFTDVLWPDFRKEHLVDAIREYQARERRFGGIETGAGPAQHQPSANRRKLRSGRSGASAGRAGKATSPSRGTPEG